MPDFTVRLSENHAGKLQGIVTRYNADNDTLLDIAGFLELHAREIAIQKDLQEAHNALVKQAESDVAVAIAATKQRLLESDAAAGKGA
jgi:hypothetical protein